MSDPRRDAERLAVCISDGEAVNWDEALTGAADEHEQRLIGQLRLVESVAQAHRSILSSNPGSPPTLDETVRAEIPRDGSSAEGNLDRWGHLELRQKLGEGAFGEVYRAFERRLDREVALKLLKSEPSQAKGLASKVIEEGRLLAKLRHPNVVTVFGAEVHDGRVGLWMEFIRGRSLEQLLREQGPFGAREAALIGVDLCRALAAVHRVGVVHRDIKAENAMREEGGRILLMDFGAGIEIEGQQSARDKSLSGTPFYMAPELFRGAPATQRSDIYSLGVLLYRLVTGAFPLEAGSWSELGAKHARREVKLLRDQRSDLPEAFVKTVERAMAFEPDERFATPGQMEQALSTALGVERAGDAGSTQRKRRALGGAGLLAAAVIVAGVLLVPWFKSERDSAAKVAAPQAPIEVPRPPEGSATPPAVPASGAYTVEAALYRVTGKSTERERLEPGARLKLGDKLTLEFQSSTPLHVYVIDEDDEGHAYALFPLPGLDLHNPLPGGTKHVLPGSLAGKNNSWLVDTPGGSEHLMVLASPTRLVQFEAEMNGLARPGKAAVAIPETARIQLRGIGGLAESPAPHAKKSAGPLFDMAQRLASRSEVVEGVWMRRIDLENPRP
jgi:eukaryotic-like serine/threonine-protein kinase